MVSLYGELAGQWNRLFPPDAERLTFLEKLFSVQSSPSILDLGCGSGATALALGRAGFRMLAADPDPQMIRTAREECAKDGLEDSVRFIESDMLSVLQKPTAFATGKQKGSPKTRDRAIDTGATPDGILCLGNTLPYLQNEDELARFFSLSTDLLSDGAALVLQILNYSRIRRLGTVRMPDLRAEGLVFSRRQEYLAGNQRVLFHTEVRSGQQRETRVHQMLPVENREMDRLAGLAGLALADRGDSWDGGEVGDDSVWVYSVYRKITGNRK